jgi:hypothetical protein
MQIDLVEPAKTDPNHSSLFEQTEYLRGVLYANADHRLDCDPERDIGKEIDPCAGGTTHFWRGVLEAGGTINVYETHGYSYPRVYLKGSYRFLRKFLDFIEEECKFPGMEWVKVDHDGKLNFQCSGGILRLQARLAQKVIQALYRDATIGQASIRKKVDKIFLWCPKHGD